MSVELVCAQAGTQTLKSNTHGARRKAYISNPFMVGEWWSHAEQGSLSVIRLSGGAFRAIWIADFVLRGRVLAGASLIQFAVPARQFPVFGIGIIRGCICRDVAGALLISFRVVLRSIRIGSSSCVCDTSEGDERGCEYGVVHGVCIRVLSQTAFFWQ